MNLRENFAASHLVGELQIGFFEGAAEAAHAVAILTDVLAFGFVEDVADVCARVAVRLDDGDEVFNQLLVEDVVFPKCVVCVDQQCVSSHLALTVRGVGAANRSPTPYSCVFSLPAEGRLRRWQRPQPV